MRRATTLFLAALLAGAAAQPLMAAEGRIREVTLSSGGLAEIVRSAPAGDGTIAIEVPLAQVDDVLKSLVVLGGGRVRGLSLGGPSAAGDVLRTMPFSSEEMKSLPRLLDTLQGTPVKVGAAGRDVVGKVLGVVAVPGADGAQDHVLTVMRDDGSAEAVTLEPGVRVEILDEAVLKKLREAADAVGRAKADGVRTLRLRLEGEGRSETDGGEVDLAYVVAAPIWKLAYRVVSEPGAGTARLQAWAVLENATGEDWQDVRLTLSSGAPVTLTQKLHQRYWRQRHEVPVDVAGSPLPQADAGAMERDIGQAPRMQKAMPSAAPAPMGGLMAPERAEFAMAEPLAEAASSEADVTATFTVAEPVDLAAGDTLSVPLIDHEVAAKRVSLFQRGVSGRHPVAALMLTNDTDTSLPPGILTIYDKAAGYVGDAQLLGMPPGEERMVAFAADRKVGIDVEDRPERRVAKVKFVDGMLHAETRILDRTVYTIDGAPDAARTVVIEHPRRQGWDFSSDALVASTPTHHRLQVEVAAGGTARVEAVNEMRQDDVLALTDAGPDLVLSWASEAADPELAGVLRDLAQARRDMAGVQRDVEDVSQTLQRIAGEQDRIRRNLAAVPDGSDLKRRYLAEMERQEGRIDEAQGRRADLESKLRQHRERVEAILRRL